MKVVVNGKSVEPCKKVKLFELEKATEVEKLIREKKKEQQRVQQQGSAQ